MIDDDAAAAAVVAAAGIWQAGSAREDWSGIGRVRVKIG